MKTFKELLIELRACSEAREWAEDKTIEQVVEQCHRGDWLLWLARKVDIGLQPLTLAKGHCANAATNADAYAAAFAAYADAYAAAFAANADAYAAAFVANAEAAVYAKKENQIQTANICRKYIGDLIIDKVNELLNTKDDTER